MNPTSSAAANDCSVLLDVTLSTILEPVSSDLVQTQKLYRETILQSAERNYIHALLTGNSDAYYPKEYHVSVADKVTHHLLNSEGKWIRAALVLLSAAACGSQSLATRQIAVAVELVHLSTLVHDDIIDEATMRRGETSIPGLCGNSVAVLLGDFLFSKAFKLLLMSESVPSQTLLTKATGQMCLGEIKQLQFAQQDDMDERDYLEMIENKTASLMAAATASGAHVGGLSLEMIEHFHGYGHSLGLAFQISDDVLDYTTSSTILGKEKGGDLRNGKITLPLIHLLRHESKPARSIMNDQKPMEEKSRDLLELMNEKGSVEYAYSVGKRYGCMAKKHLKELEQEIGPSTYLRSLESLVDFVLSRNC